MNEWLMVGMIALAFLFICFLLEAVVLALFKVSRLGKAFLYSLLVNFVSLLAIYLAWPLTDTFRINTGNWFPLLPILFPITVLFESLLLKWIQKTLPWRRLFVIVTVMNLCSFAALYVFLMLI